MSGLVRHEPEQSPDAAMLPLLPRAASAGPGLHPPVADWRVSGRLPDAVPALEVFRERAVHKGVCRRGVHSTRHAIDETVPPRRLHVSELQPPVADWRGSGRLPEAMRGQPHHLTLREGVLPVRTVDRRNSQQRRHPALKSGSPRSTSLSDRFPAALPCLCTYYLRLLLLTSASNRWRRSCRASGLMLRFNEGLDPCPAPEWGQLALQFPVP